MPAKSWSWKQKLQDLSAVYSLILIRIFGLWPYTKDHRTNEFKSTWFLKLQPILTGIILLIPFAVILPKKWPSVTRQWKSDAANVFTDIFGTLQSASLIATYISIFLQTQRVKSIIIRSQEFMVKSQRLLTEDAIRTTSAILKYLFKSFVILACYTTLVSIILWMTTQSMPGYVLPFVVLPVLLIATVPNLFFGTILFATVYFERINAKIAEIVRNANLLMMQKYRKFGRMHQYCELSDLLDELAVLHMELTRLTQDVCKLCNLHITGYISWHSMNAIVQKLFIYICISNGLMELIVFPTTLIVIWVLTIILIWIDLIMFAHLCFTIICEVVLHLWVLELIVK